MWNFTTLTLQRFQSYLDQTYTFIPDKAVMVCGRNLTDEGQESNGSGKSALLEGLVVCLTGDNLRGVRDAEMIMNGQTDSRLILIMENPVLKRIMTIERRFFAGKPSKVMVYINSLIQTSITSVKEANAFILSQLDISKEDLLNNYLIHRENYTSFLTSTDKTKKDLINRFSNANLVDAVFPLIDTKSKALYARLGTTQQSQMRCEAKIEALEQQLDQVDLADQRRLMTRLIEERQGALAQVRDDRQYVVNRIAVKSEELEAVQIQLFARKEIKRPEQLSTIGEHITGLKDEARELRGQFKEAQSLNAEFDLALQGVVACPECNHRFAPGDPTLDPQQTKKDLVEVLEVIKELRADIDTNMTLQEKLTIDLQTAKALETESNAELRRIALAHLEIEQQITSLRRNLTHLDQDVLRAEQALTAAQNTEIHDPRKTLNNDLLELRQQVRALEQEAIVHEDEYTDHAQWTTRFKEFKSTLANKSVSTIGGYTNLYLKQIKSNLQIELDGFRVLSDGKMKEEITATVLRDGEEAGTYRKFSSGERARIDICTIIAMQELINQRSSSGGLNMLILDEVIDSVDAKGLYSILHAINTLRRSIIVVTLGNFTSEYEFKLLVTKQDGRSTLTA